jgi:hypothetical protein
MIPGVLGRQYSMLVRDVRKTYTDRKGSKPKQRPYRTGEGTWGWEPLGDDVATEGPSTTTMHVTGGPLEACQMLWYADGDYVYHVALNKSGEGGEVMWCGEDMTGGVPAVVLPGRVTPLRGPDRYWPWLYPVYQMVKLINRCRAKRESRSDNAKPDVLVERSADQLKAVADAKAAGVNMEDEELQLDQGAPSIVYVGGRPVPWDSISDEDLDKLEQSYWQELDRYVSSLLESLSPSEVAHSTANAYLGYAEGRRRQQAPMLANLDWCWAEILKMWIHSIKAYDETCELFSSEETKYGKGKTIGAGELIALTPADVDFKYTLKVETRSMTDAEVRFRVEDWANRKALGLSTKREGVSAAAYPDEQGQLQELYEEAGQDLATPFIQEQVKLAIMDRVRLSSRVLVNLGTAPITAPPQGDPNAGFAPMRPPAAAPAGGSGAGLLA